MAHEHHEIAEALRSKGADAGDCPVCGAKAWGISDAPALLLLLDEQTDLSVAKGTSGDPAPKGNISTNAAPVMPITCESCGFVRLFHIATLLHD